LGLIEFEKGTHPRPVADANDIYIGCGHYVRRVFRGGSYNFSADDGETGAT
jgi:hypothetical protein